MTICPVSAAGKWRVEPRLGLDEGGSDLRPAIVTVSLTPHCQHDTAKVALTGATIDIGVKKIKHGQ